MGRIDPERLSAVVRRLADAELKPRFATARRRHKADGSIVTEADLTMQSRLKAALLEEWPELPLLGEEMSLPEPQALLRDHPEGLWLLDPLDGTSNFASGIPFYAVSLALLRHGRVELGLVYDPSRGETFLAQQGRGAWLNGQPLRSSDRPAPESLERCIALLDFKRLPPRLVGDLVRRPPFASQRNFGAVALEWCWIAAGRGHLYLHGKQQLWDYAAGHRILLEAGGEACTFEGEPMFNPSLQPRSAVAAGEHRLFSEWRRRLSV